MRSLTVFLYLMASISLFSQQNRALLVGVSDYPVSSGWSRIHSDNDIKLLQQEIVKKGFSINIIQNREATKKGIFDALTKLLRNCRENDTIVIHFSCHGQQKLSSEKELLESLVPYDAKKYYRQNEYQGENHLLDHELGKYLNEIRKKIGEKGVLFVTIDACHSGDAVRAMDEDTPVRGTNSVFTDDPFYTRPNVRHVQKNKVIPKLNTWSSFCAVYACQSFQNNYEVKVDNSYYGSLSYAFYQVLKSDNSCNPFLWAKGIVAEMNKRVKKQNPYFESTFTF